ncbi:hypothetical protein JCM11491_004312 [Sporobolomyces phaffii]
MLSRWASRPLSIAACASSRIGLASSLFRLSSTRAGRPHSTLRALDHDGRRGGALSGPKLKGVMIEHLAHARPRAALRAFVDHLDRPDSSHSARTLEGLVWTLCAYREPAVALEAVAHMHRAGYAVSTRLAAKLLRAHAAEVMFDPDRLVTVLKWIQAGIRRDHAARTRVDAHLVETVIDALKRIGRTDWCASVFAAYRESLGGDADADMGHPRVWAAAISAHAAGGDVQAAQLLFNDWRTAHFASRPRPPDSGSPPPPPPPPEGPYLALLNHFAVNCPPLPASKDPAYLLLQLVKADRVPLSTPFLNALLRVELSRKRFSSFWGIWALFDGDAGVARDHSAWKLASRAKLVSDASRRQRGRLHRSPLLHLAPVPYAERHTPTSRSLFARLLATRLELTSHRPALRLPTSKPDPLAASASPSRSSDNDLTVPSRSASASLLNSFLALFLSHQDFAAAAVVLETFHVHRVAPTAATHSTVVLSVIKLWERGQFDPFSPPHPHPTSSSSSESSTPLVVPGGSGTLAVEGYEASRRARAAKHLRGPRAVEAIRTILERREVRVGLWQQQHQRAERADDAQDDLEEPGGVEGEGKGGGGRQRSVPPSPPSPPPRWMVQREMRDTTYLVELLAKCSGLDADGWRLEVDHARRELLPARREAEQGRRGGEREEQPDKKKSKRKITRGARYRKEVFGKEL